jgi:hypothetical protein
MRKLSTGQDATLGNYRKLTAAVFGSDSKAVAFLDEKIKSEPEGENAEVLVEEGQTIALLASIHFGEAIP